MVWQVSARGAWDRCWSTTHKPGNQALLELLNSSNADTPHGHIASRKIYKVESRVKSVKWHKHSFWEVYIYMYVYICAYMCKYMPIKWMSTGLMLACHKNGWVVFWVLAGCLKTCPRCLAQAASTLAGQSAGWATPLHMRSINWCSRRLVGPRNQPNRSPEKRPWEALRRFTRNNEEETSMKLRQWQQKPK